MSAERFRPSVTVAAIVEQRGRFLLVEEETPEGLRLNNPAGHLDEGETLLEAVVREALEETARVFRPEALLGVYMSRFRRPARGEDVTYVRFAVCGSVGEPEAGRALLDLAADREPCAEDMPGLRRAMRALLLHHLGGRGLKSWELIAALPRADAPAAPSATQPEGDDSVS